MKIENKTVLLKYGFYGSYQRLTRYTNTETGECIYIKGGSRLSTRDELNDCYLKTKRKYTDCKVTTTVIMEDLETVIDRFESAIDPYVGYIEDGSQYQSACDFNDRMREIVAKLNAFKE